MSANDVYVSEEYLNEIKEELTVIAKYLNNLKGAAEVDCAGLLTPFVTLYMGKKVIERIDKMEHNMAHWRR